MEEFINVCDLPKTKMAEMMMKKSLRFFCVVVSLVSSRVNDVSLRTTASMTSDCVSNDDELPKFQNGGLRDDWDSFFFRGFKKKRNVQTGGDDR